MILTLVAQTSKWASGLKKAAGNAVTFGSVVKGAMRMVSTAMLGLAGSLIFFLPNFIKMGEEARKSELRLKNIATQMGLFGENTGAVTERLSAYAEAISFATGVDDELVRSAEAILLTFKELAKTADTTGGAFDRATIAAVDLAAAGFGEVDSNAKQLGKALQDPIKGLTALRKAGVTFTKAEERKIKALVEDNKLLQAQDLILKAIETQVGGTAAATASATDKMGARFENVLETLSTALLPAVDDIAQAFSDWLDSREGKKAINDLAKAFADFGKWITSADGKASIDALNTSLKLFGNTVVNVTKGIKLLIDMWNDWLGLEADLSNQSAPGAPARTGPAIPAPTQGTTDTRRTATIVNITGLTPSATIGRTVIAAINNANRLGMR
jgi:phage-related minor tail protein